MNRRNLLKSLFVLPFVGMLKALPLRGPAKGIINYHGDTTLGPSISGSYTRASRTATGTAELNRIQNERLDNIAMGVNPVYVKSRFSGTVRILETAATHKDTYQLDSKGNIKQLLSREYLVDRDCGHSEWVTSPDISDPAGVLAKTYPFGGVAPLWPGNCLKCLTQFT